MYQSSAIEAIAARSIAMRCRPDADFFLNDQTTSASATTTVASFLNTPTDTDVFLVRITPGGTTASVPAGNVAVTGLAWDDTELDFIEKTVNIALDANQNTAEDSTVPFRKIEQIVFPVQDGAGATYDVGISPVVDFRFGVKAPSSFAWTSARIRYSDTATDTEPITFTLDSGHGSAFDVPLFALDLFDESATSYIQDFAVPQILTPGDALDITKPLNTGDREIMVELVGFLT